MSVNALEWAFHRAPVSSPTQANVLHAMAWKTLKSGETKDLPVSELRKMTRLSERAVRQAVSDLIALGLVEVMSERACANRYRLRLSTWHAPPAGAAAAGGAADPQGMQQTHPSNGVEVPRSGSETDNQVVAATVANASLAKQAFREGRARELGRGGVAS